MTPILFRVVLNLYNIMRSRTGCCCCHLLQHTVNFTGTLNMQQTPETSKYFLGLIITFK